MSTKTQPWTALRLTAFALLLGFSAAHAQPADPTQVAPKAKSPPKPAAIAVSEPLIIDALGITVLTPQRVTANVTSQPGGKTTAVITPLIEGFQSPDRGPDWVIQITNERTEDLSLTIDAILDEFEKQRRDRARVDEKGMRIFDRMSESDNLTIAGRKAGRFYCELTAAPGDALMTGYTVFSTKPGEFIIVQLDCMSSYFDTSRVTYETIAASATFEDPLAVAEARAMALMAGAAFLAELTAEDLKAVLSPEPIYFRYYQPSTTGADADATEVAFQRLQIRDGQAGEVDAYRSRDNWSSADREFGFLVQVDARAMQGSTTIDTRSIHFLSRDRANESWSISNTIRDGKQSTSVLQTMIRRGDRMTVKTLRDGPNDEQRDWTLPEKGYLSAVERFMLPGLVALKNPPGSPAALDFAFISYDTKTEKLTIRRDAFTNTDGQGWRYISQPERTDQEILTLLDAQGNLIRRTVGDGIVVEPIDVDRLRRLWRDKGLLME